MKTAVICVAVVVDDACTLYVNTIANQMESRGFLQPFNLKGGWMDAVSANAVQFVM